MSTTKLVWLWTLLAWATCVGVWSRDIPSASIHNLSPTFRLLRHDEYVTLRDSETGLLTGNELLGIFYKACDAVRGVIDLLNNPVFSVLGISGTVMHIPIPIPTAALNPLGIPSFIKNSLLSLQNSINSLGKRDTTEERFGQRLQFVLEKMQERQSALSQQMAEREEEESTLTVGDVVKAVDYPCQALDLAHSFLNNSSYIGWLQLGQWPLPLRDPLFKLNLLAVPGKIFSSIFGR